MMELAVDDIKLEISYDLHALARSPGFEDVPIQPHNWAYKLEVISSEPEEKIREMHAQVQAMCPLYNLVVNPQSISSELVVFAS